MDDSTCSFFLIRNWPIRAIMLHFILIITTIPAGLDKGSFHIAFVIHFRLCNSVGNRFFVPFQTQPFWLRFWLTDFICLFKQSSLCPICRTPISACSEYLLPNELLFSSCFYIAWKLQVSECWQYSTELLYWSNTYHTKVRKLLKSWNRICYEMDVGGKLAWFEAGQSRNEAKIEKVETNDLYSWFLNCKI